MSRIRPWTNGDQVALDGSGNVPVVIDSTTPVNVLGPLTDAELRASAVNVLGPLTDAELRATDVPVSGPLTDTELRATEVPISGVVGLVDPVDLTRYAELDNLFRALLVVDVVHHEVHEGDAFTMQTYDEGAASGDVIQLYFKTPATASPQKRIHLVSEREGSGEHQFILTEGITYSAGGATRTPLNKNRGSIKTSAVTVPLVGSDKAGNVITYTGGTIIYDAWVGLGKSVVGENRGTVEWVLAPETEYIFEVFSKTNPSLTAVILEWYEHTDG